MAGLHGLCKLHEQDMNVLKREESYCQQAAEVALLSDHVCQQAISIIKFKQGKYTENLSSLLLPLLPKPQ